MRPLIHRRRLPFLPIAVSLALATAAKAQSLYWLDTRFSAPTLNKSDALGNNILSVSLTAQTLPEGLACDAGGNVYWTEAVVTSGRVQRASPALTGIATLVTGNSAMRGIATDVAGGKLYWTTSNLFIGSTVRRSAMNGSGFTNLILLGNAANPRGIAVDHDGGKLYWADFDADALYRSNLDGSGQELWLQLPVNAHPYGVAIDGSAAQQVYWTEYAGKIRRRPLAGGSMTTLFSGLANPTYLALDLVGGQMFWSEGGAGAQHIYRGALTGGARTLLALPLTTYGGLAFAPNASVSAPPEALPAEFALAPLAPNPSSGPVRAEFTLPRESHVRVSVIDLQGREVAVLVDGTYPAGRHAVTWETNAGRPAPAGVYFVRMAVGARAWMRRLVHTR